jgi:short-subunit dehydrogenase
MKKDTALIVGVSGGPRFELVRKLAQNGHDLIFVGASRPELELAAKDVRQAFGADVRLLVSDLANEAAASAIFREVEASGASIEILVNNVSVKACDASRNGPPGKGAAIRQSYVEAVMRLTRLFLLPMIGRGRGRVINTLAIGAADIKAGPAGCLVARDFVLSLTQLPAAELADTGIDVTALYPDMVNTRYFQVVHFEGKSSPEIRAAATILAFAPSTSLPRAPLLPELASRFSRSFFNFGRRTALRPAVVAHRDAVPDRTAGGPRPAPGATARGGARVAISRPTESRPAAAAARVSGNKLPSVEFGRQTENARPPQTVVPDGSIRSQAPQILLFDEAQGTPDDRQPCSWQS